MERGISPDQNEDIKSTIESLRKDWNILFPEKTFEFSFLDEQLQQQYSGFVNSERSSKDLPPSPC